MEGVGRIRKYSMPEISIIVPVYKVEQYLKDCVDSILKQNYQDFELLLIDDGSPDSCGIICDEYAEQDERITVIHEQNKGVSFARNVGLDLAKGKYIAFIDSDDVINKNYLDFLYNSIIRKGADISVCEAKEFKTINECELEKKTIQRTNKIVYLTGKEAALSWYSEQRGRMRIEPWAKLFKKSLFKDMRFPTGMRYEDAAIIPIVFQKARQVVWLKEKLYGYRQREDSFMHGEFSLKRYDGVRAIDNCIKYFNEIGDLDLTRAAKKSRKVLIANYSLIARRYGFYEKLPSEYRMSRINAIRVMRNLLPYDMYSYRLSQLYPVYIFIESHMRRVLQLLRIVH